MSQNMYTIYNFLKSIETYFTPYNQLEHPREHLEQPYKDQDHLSNHLGHPNNHPDRTKDTGTP
jgi:hypothetical protein